MKKTGFIVQKAREVDHIEQCLPADVLKECQGHLPVYQNDQLKCLPLEFDQLSISKLTLRA